MLACAQLFLKMIKVVSNKRCRQIVKVNGRASPILDIATFIFSLGLSSRLLSCTSAVIVTRVRRDVRIRPGHVRPPYHRTTVDVESPSCPGNASSFTGAATLIDSRLGITRIKTN